ncbi:MAG: hypothetical protein WBG65_14200 [Sulfurimonadaceae bacterium]
MDVINEIPEYFKYVITVLGAFLAILGLFMDRKQGYFRFVAPLFIVLIIILGVFQAADAMNSDREADQAKAKMTNVLTLVDNISFSSARTSTYLTDILLSQPKILKDFGLTKVRAGKPLDQIYTAELIKGEILDANKYRMELIVAKPPSKRLSTQVWYYNKEIDNPQLVASLKEVGFTVKNKIAKQNQANDSTNAVWHGSEIELDDYKAVIVSLIRAGIDIRRVGPSCKNINNKINVIEVGASDLAEGLIDGIQKPTKSIQEIRSAKSFDSLDDFKCP